MDTHVVRVTLQFHGDLEDFFPSRRRASPLVCVCHDRTTIKHLIEACGVPHTEIGAVIANDNPVELNDPVAAGVQLDVYPFLDHIHPRPSDSEPSFVLDNHLGKLAVYLRILGFDALYDNHSNDEELAAISEHEKRILLTRDRGLLKRKTVKYGFCILRDNPREQILLVVRRYDLAGCIRPFTRCLRCNALLQPVEKAAILDRLQPQTRQYYDHFNQCPLCRQIYWPGSHYRRMQALVEEVIAGSGRPREE